MRKVPFIPQYNTTECGVCVVTMILQYFGAYYTLAEVRERMPIVRDGATIRMLIDTFAYYGIDAYAYHGIVNEEMEYELPAIINWENSHYVIIEKITSKYVKIVDSNIGRIKVSFEEFREKYSGIIILLKRGENFKKRKKEHSYKNSFSPLCTVYRREILRYLLITLLVQLFVVAIPIEIRYLVDEIQVGKFMAEKLMILLGTILLSAVFQYFKGYYMSLLGVWIDRDVNTGVISKLLKVSYNFYERKSNNEIFYALNNIGCVKSIYLNEVVNSVFAIITIIFVYGYLFWLNRALCLFVFFIFIFNIGVLVLTDEPIQRDMKLLIKEEGDLSAHQVEMIYSMLGIKASSLEIPIFDRWQYKYDMFYRKNKDYQIKLNIFSVLLSLVVTLSPIVVLIVAIFYAYRGFFTVGAALSFYAMADVLFSAIYTVLYSVRNLRNDMVTLERLEEIMRSKEEIYFSNNNSTIRLNGEIIVRNVSFAYSKGSEKVIKNISLKVPENGKIAIIGSSGSGKSTLLKVLSGLYELNEGEIIYGGYSLFGEYNSAIKQQIGFVAQNTWLMNKSILENITMGLQNVGFKDVEEACRITNIHEEIMRMPMKYQTIISETGKNISGGQCQRIILARMVLLKPKILLLDEATNALDFINEQHILEYFYKMKCTVIMVTHRGEFLKNCDNIIVMDKGKIAMQGKYYELKEKSEVFCDLVR